MKAITSKQMSKIDELMLKNGIELVIMMENAGLSLAMLAAKINKYKKNRKIVVLVGKGNNGGGGLTCSRHLQNFGYNVKVILASSSLKKVPLKQLKILRKIKVPIYEYNNKSNNNNLKKIVRDSNLVIDALLGYNARGNPYGNVKELIILANKSRGKILSLDIPSGLHPDIGSTYMPCIKANYTLTLAYPKKGLLSKNARDYVGRLYLSYLTIPNNLPRKIAIKINYDFSKNIFVGL